ncbi:inovirus-type Gp2 protein [Allochromatium humboldtianum]|uniref:Inovirus-type Gp2 protein n=1 Tax=Allochromatium humboldtianum TaxID=504901 RepID=A0A850RRA0_9GAMM|nr:inovirus-type Gp2 protein [Allochromatium humboldtianum]NVZ11433.1 inovirus-type Gp2 protein [Allochromatium humboldtianum]
MFQIDDTLFDAYPILRDSLLQRKYNKLVESLGYITQDQDALDALIRVVELGLALDQHQQGDPLFTLQRTLRGQTYLDVRQHPLGYKLYQAIRFDASLIRRHFSLHQFDPWIACFLRQVEQQPDLQEILQLYREDAITIDHRRVYDALQTCVQALRSLLQYGPFFLDIQQRYREMQHRHQRLHSYVKSRLEQTEKLMVCRVELTYQDPIRYYRKRRPYITFDQTLDHQQAFAQSFATLGLFEHLVGTIWKLSYSACRGFYYQWFFFFDGNAVLSGWEMSDRIGKHWRELVGDKARFWNQHVDSGKYQRLGTGMIERDQWSRWCNLDLALRNLCVVDYFMQLQHPQRRTFGRGYIRRSPEVRLEYSDAYSVEQSNMEQHWNQWRAKNIA